MIWLAVAVGGALGSMARHAVNVYFAHVLERAIPYATGAVTTFSSFMLDTFTLGHGGDHSLAFWNVALQVALGLCAVWGGYRLGTAL